MDPPPKDRSTLVLDAVLRALRPAVRLLLQNGVHYGALAAALKRVFLAAAQDELKARGMAQTDSAVTLLSGVHRRDVRTLLRAVPDEHEASVRKPMSLASEVVLCWLSGATWRTRRGTPRVLARGAGEGSFDALVGSVSSDIRPRAVLDELVRLGVAEETDAGVRLLMDNFVPKDGFEQMALLFGDNLHDHMAAAAQNLQFNRDLLEQSVHVDEITQESAERLHRAALKAWRETFRPYFSLAQQRFDADTGQPPTDQPTYRARFGAYFLIERDDRKEDDS